MKNEEAVSAMRNLMHSLNEYYGLSERGQTAFRMAITALEERKRGKWIRYDGYWLKTMYKCSECGAMIEINGKYNINFFCYHCGADMRERSEE